LLDNILKILSVRILVRVVNLALAVLIARVLGPVLQGQLSFLLLIGGLSYSFASLGLDTGAIYFIRRQIFSRDSYFESSIPLLAISIVILLIILIIAGAILPQEYLGQFNPNDLLLVMFFIPLEAFSSFLRYFLIAEERFDEFNKVELYQAISLLLIVAGAMYFQHGAVTLVILGYLVNRVIIITWLVKTIAIKEKINWNLKAAKKVLSFSLKPWTTNLFSILNIRVDTIMVSWFIALGLGVDAQDLGLYTVCVFAVAKIRDVQAAIQTAFFPRISSMDGRDAVLLTGKVYRLSFLIYLIIFIGVAIVGMPVLMIFGESYLEAYPVLLALTFATMLIRANSGAISIYLTSNGKPEVPMKCNLVGTVLNIVANIVLIPQFGLLGAALATVLAASVVKFLLVLSFLKITKQIYFSVLWVCMNDLQEIIEMLKVKLRFIKSGK
jgi:O-antigen/teichoic acid export membrane protein